MPMAKFDVEFFQKSDGTMPAKDFISEQDVKMRAKIYRMLTLLEERGNELREPYSKNLTDGIFEIRAKQGNNITRVLYFFYVNNKIILTNGFVKKSQKTPVSKIEIARKYKEEYIKENR